MNCIISFVTFHPNKMSGNGSILAGILERNVLTVVNGLEDKCTGLITRERTTTNGDEKSVIDFVIVSQDLVEMIKSMLIDDKRKHVLTRLTKTKKGIKKRSLTTTLL